MKKGLHPVYFAKAEVKCDCGAAFTVGSTLKKIHLEICSACHPLFTGKQKVLDTAGRVDRFKKRQTKSNATRTRVLPSQS